MKTITGKDNGTYKMCKSLLLKKNRDKRGLYLLEGPNSVKEAVASGRVRIVILREGVAERDGFEKEAFSNAKTVVMGKELFNRLTQTKTDQGILAVVEKEDLSPDEFFKRVKENGGNILVMDAVQDPGNIGTMIRTAVGAGYGGIIGTKGTGDIYSPKVVRATTGALFRIPILISRDSWTTVRDLKEEGIAIIGTNPGGAVDYRKADFPRPCALIVGNEGKGMSRVFEENAQGNVTIPMAGGLESLNASVAAGILMYRSTEKGN